MRRTLFFLRYNWGAPFILVFISLIVASAIYMSAGFESYSNICAIFGFYSLVVGVLLQIASFLVYGNKAFVEDTPTYLSTNPKYELGRKYRIIAVITLIGVSSIVVGISIFPAAASPILPNFSTTTPQILEPLRANIFFVKVFPEPQNQTLISFGVSATGAIGPYTFNATWSDDVIQSNDYGTFSRTIQSGQVIPTDATVVITSANNQSISLTVRTPNEISSTTRSFQSLSSFTFVELGLPLHIGWSVQLNASQKSSQNNSIVFSDLRNGIYNFSAAYEFSGNISSAFRVSPSNGVVLVNGSNEVQNISFTRIPVNQLLTPVGEANVSIANRSVSITGAYKNNLPMPMDASVIVAVNDSSGHLVKVSTATLHLGPNSIDSTKIFLLSLSPGNYSATLYALYENQAVSPESEFSFTVS